MIFSYKAGAGYILERVRVPLGRGRCTLLTGVENGTFGLVGGILAGLFPIEKQETVPQLDQLMEMFTGELEIHEGASEAGNGEISIYLGPDPERHFLFSRVDEELYAQTGGEADPEALLEAFELGAKFLSRRISTLSGGEKMKIALSIAFSGAFRLLVLHGVVPWLDRAGKRILFREIERAKRSGRAVVLLEQEIDDVVAAADDVLRFDGSSLAPFRKVDRARSSRKAARLAGRVGAGSFPREIPAKGVDAGRAANRRPSSQPPSTPIVEFDQVRFSYSTETGDRGPTETGFFSLDGISFSLEEGGVYGLSGDNGSGKSTIAKLILRAERATGGSVRFLGRDISTLSRDELVRSICYVGQFPERQIALSSVEEFRERARRLGNRVSEGLLEDCFGGRGPLPVSVLTPLDLKLLLLASSAGPDTRLIILDEPTWGIDIEGENVLLEVLARIMHADGDPSGSVGRDAGHGKGPRHRRSERPVPRLPEPALLVISHDGRLLRNLHASTFHVEHGKLHAARPDIAVESPHAQKPSAGPYRAEQPAGEGAGKPRKTAAYLRVPAGTFLLLLKFLLLAAGASVFFVLFPFALRYGLPLYVSLLALLAAAGAAFRFLAGKRSFATTLTLWLGGSAVYALIALPLILKGVQPLTYVKLDTLDLILYYVSYPLRVLGVFFVGMIFMRILSPVEFLKWGRTGLGIALAFRGFEYSVNAFEETRRALVVQGELPDPVGGKLGISFLGRALKGSSILIATTFRNILLWFPWAWICYNSLMKHVSERRHT